MRFVAICLSICSIAYGADRLTASGSVVDEATKQPIANATVMVYSAGVKSGYDLFCPTCYVDCGKRATTDSTGAFSIAGLSPDLQFNLLVVGEGYAPTFIRNLDPAKGAAPPIAVKTRTTPTDNAQVARGRVVDAAGDPVRDALVSQQGVIFENGRAFGARDWLDLIAVTNRNGEFDIAYAKPAKSVIVEVAARGMAPKLTVVPTGGDRHTLTVREGATVRGRLMHAGKPVPNAQFVLSTHSRAAGTAYGELRIGTNADGEFAITNVPAGRIFDLVPVMDSLAPKSLAAAARFVATADDGQEVNVGIIDAYPAFTMRGRIVLTDGSPIVPGMRVSLMGDRSSDRQTLLLPPDGQFEFKGLAKGVYVISAAVKGYQTLDPEVPMEVLVEGDRKDFNISLKPAVK